MRRGLGKAGRREDGAYPGGMGLVVLGDDPLRPCERPEDARALLRGMPVLATVCAGRVTHRADP